MEAMKAAWRAACAGPRDVRRRFFGEALMVTGEGCVLSVCTDCCVGPGFGCMEAVVSSKMGDSAVLELATWASSFGPVGMTPSMLVGLFVSSIAMLAGRADARVSYKQRRSKTRTPTRHRGITTPRSGLGTVSVRLVFWKAEI